jgi:hypothetical protein
MAPNELSKILQFGTAKSTVMPKIRLTIEKCFFFSDPHIYGRRRLDGSQEHGDDSLADDRAEAHRLSDVQQLAEGGEQQHRGQI